MSQKRDSQGRFLPKTDHGFDLGQEDDSPNFLSWLLVSFLIAALLVIGIQQVFAASRADLEKDFNAFNQQAFHHEQLAKQFRESAKNTRCALVSIKLHAGEELRDPSQARIDCADTIPEDFWLGTPK